MLVPRVADVPCCYAPAMSFNRAERRRKAREASKKRRSTDWPHRLKYTFIAPVGFLLLAAILGWAILLDTRDWMKGKRKTPW